MIPTQQVFFLSVLEDDFKVNIIVFQSDDAMSWVVNLSNKENPFKKTLNFTRSLSLHIDPVIPCEKLQNFKCK